MNAAEFFDHLAASGDEPSWAHVVGSVRFDVRDGAATSTTVVRIARGQIEVARGAAPADCTITLDRAVLEGLVNGRGNLMALVLRGTVVCTGDPELLLVIQRVFPARVDTGPARATEAVR